MKSHLFAYLVLCFTFVKSTYAQTIQENTQKGFKYNNNFDLALGIGDVEFSSALSWAKLHGIGKKKKFKIGYGLRLSNYFASDKVYKTAPANLIENKKIDEIYISFAQTNSLNATINMQYSLSANIEFGFNIDAVGISFGAKQNIARTGINVAKAAPTSGNFLLIGNNDIGSLNSEFYLRYWFSEKFAIRAGFSHLFSEYTTNTKLAYNNDRYRLITNLGFIAFTFSPYR